MPTYRPLSYGVKDLPGNTNNIYYFVNYITSFIPNDRANISNKLRKLDISSTIDFRNSQQALNMINDERIIYIFNSIGKSEIITTINNYYKNIFGITPNVSKYEFKPLSTGVKGLDMYDKKMDTLEEYIRYKYKYNPDTVSNNIIYSLNEKIVDNNFFINTFDSADSQKALNMLNMESVIEIFTKLKRYYPDINFIDDINFDYYIVYGITPQLSNSSTTNDITFDKSINVPTVFSQQNCNMYTDDDPYVLYDILNDTEPSMYGYMLECLQKKITDNDRKLNSLVTSHEADKKDAITASEMNRGMRSIYQSDLFFTISKVFMFIILICAYVYFLKYTGIIQPIKDGAKIVKDNLDKVKDIKLPKLQMPEVTMPSIKMPYK